MSRLHPLVLSGGSGSRLWPVSRELFPKQLLPLCSDRPLIVETLDRLKGLSEVASARIICNVEHRFLIAQTLSDNGMEQVPILLEPEGRNTAAAVAIGALSVAEEDPDGLILILPSDHLIVDEGAFCEAVEIASQVARQDYLLTFGVTPTRAETGYGYLCCGAEMERTPGVFLLDRFVEKPDQEKAETFVASGNHYWNAGIFLGRASVVLNELERQVPDILSAMRRALEHAQRDLDFLRLEPEAFKDAPSISFDYAVMEGAERTAMVPVNMEWSDVGSWQALWEETSQDNQGNALVGDVIAVDAQGSYLRAEDGMLLAAAGVEDLVVVATRDTVMVVPRKDSQKVKDLVGVLKSKGREEHIYLPTVYRPWGSYRSIDEGPRFQVKRITVAPGSSLSLQYHHHRAEHWIVVEGTARVIRGEESFRLHEDESTYIPMGVPHRLENPGKVPLKLVEVQSGGYLGEDDIVRLDDVYNREDEAS